MKQAFFVCLFFVFYLQDGPVVCARLLAVKNRFYFIHRWRSLKTRLGLVEKSCCFPGTRAKFTGFLNMYEDGQHRHMVPGNLRRRKVSLPGEGAAKRSHSGLFLFYQPLELGSRTTDVICCSITSTYCNYGFNVIDYRLFATTCDSYSLGFGHFTVKRKHSIYIFLHCTFYLTHLFILIIIIRYTSSYIHFVHIRLFVK